MLFLTSFLFNCANASELAKAKDASEPVEPTNPSSPVEPTNPSEQPPTASNAETSWDVVMFFDDWYGEDTYADELLMNGTYDKWNLDDVYNQYFDHPYIVAINHEDINDPKVLRKYMFTAKEEYKDYVTYTVGDFMPSGEEDRLVQISKGVAQVNTEGINISSVNEKEIVRVNIYADTAHTQLLKYYSVIYGCIVF